MVEKDIIVEKYEEPRYFIVKDNNKLYRTSKHLSYNFGKAEIRKNKESDVRKRNETEVKKKNKTDMTKNNETKVVKVTYKRGNVWSSDNQAKKIYSERIFTRY